MRIFEITGSQVDEHDALAPLALPGACPAGYLWLSLAREEFRASLADVQGVLQSLCGTPLVDLHVSDLLNDQLPSHYDYTSQYDVLVFRRLAAGQSPGAVGGEPRPGRGGPPVLRRIDTRPVGFAVFDRVLLSVHPDDGAVRDAYAAKLLAAARSDRGDGAAPALDVRATSARVPTGPADLMLRVVNQIVDAYLDLRRELTRQLDHWQAELIARKAASPTGVP
jgi:magnesium transporter